MRKIKRSFFRTVFPRRTTLLLLLQLARTITPAQAADFSHETQAQITEVRKEAESSEKDSSKKAKLVVGADLTVNRMYDDICGSIVAGKLDLAIKLFPILIDFEKKHDPLQAENFERELAQLKEYKSTLSLQKDANVKGFGWFVIMDTPKGEGHTGFQAHLEYFEILRRAHGLLKQISLAEFEEAIISGGMPPDSKEAKELWHHVKDLHERKNVHLN